MKKDYTIILLAAGSSTRMGEAKLLKKFNETCLLEKCIIALKQVQQASICVVTGAYHSEMQDIISRQQVSQVYNEAWKSGMSSSIITGLYRAIENQSKAAIICIADQVFFTSEIIIKLIECYEKTNTPVIYSRYQSGEGPPVLFDISLFDVISELKGDQGAKKVWSSGQVKSTYIDFPTGDQDVDTLDQFSSYFE